MSMREKIARAIYHSQPRNRTFDLLKVEYQRQYLRKADAVLDALMEPTEGMITEGFAVNSDDIGQPERAKRGQVRVFRAMIQAARDGE